MQQEETKLQREIREALEEEFPNSFWFKSHGNMFQMSGLPDLIGNVCGLYCGLEVKLPSKTKSKTSKVQKEVLKDIRASGGLGTTVRDPEQAIRKVYKHLRKYYGKDVKKQIRALSEARSKVRLQREEGSFVHATWDWQDHNVFSSVSKSSKKRTHHVSNISS